jgi:hypothetical protein
MERRRGGVIKQEPAGATRATQGAEMRIVLGLCLAAIVVGALPVLTGLIVYAVDKYLVGGCRAAFGTGSRWLQARLRADGREWPRPGQCERPRN